MQFLQNNTPGNVKVSFPTLAQQVIQVQYDIYDFLEIMKRKNHRQSKFDYYHYLWDIYSNTLND